MFTRLRPDIQCILERDPPPAAAGRCSPAIPGLHALVLHRRAHWCWTHGFKWLGRFISHTSRWLTGIEIHPGAKIAPLRVHRPRHGRGDWRNRRNRPRLHHLPRRDVAAPRCTRAPKRHPTLGSNVIVGAGAKVLGGFTVGDGAKVGSNAVVTKPVLGGRHRRGQPWGASSSRPSPTRGARRRPPKWASLPTA